MPHAGVDWWGVVADVIKLAAGAVFGLIGFVCGRLYERSKPIRFKVFEWKVLFADQQNEKYERVEIPGVDKVWYVRFDFDTLFFNCKSTAISLREINVEFRAGKGHRSKFLCRQNEFFFRCGGEYVSVDEKPAHFIDLAPHESVEVRFWGSIPKEHLAELLRFQSVWLVAESTEKRGKRYRWRLASVKTKPIANG